MNCLESVGSRRQVSEPLWLQIARRELQNGVLEIPGAEHSPRILAYHSSVSGNFDTDEIPWCSSLINWLMEQCGISRTGSGLARSWLAWGKSVTHPPVGAVTVLQRGQGPQPGIENLTAPGHVGLFIEDASAHQILLLGGNQRNMVRISAYPKRDVLSYRWPG